MHGPPPEGALEDDERAALAQLLAGNGAKLPLVAKLVASWVKLPAGSNARGPDDSPCGIILVDDAMEVDDPSLEAIRRASLATTATIRLVIRLDSASPIPPLLGGLQAGREFQLGPLPRPIGEQLANAITCGQLSPEGQKRWARRGRLCPARDHRSLTRRGRFRRAHVGRRSDRAEQPRCGATFAARPKRVDRASAPLRVRACS